MTIRKTNLTKHKNICCSLSCKKAISFDKHACICLQRGNVACRIAHIHSLFTHYLLWFIHCQYHHNYKIRVWSQEELCSKVPAYLLSSVLWQQTVFLSSFQSRHDKMSRKKIFLCPVDCNRAHIHPELLDQTAWPYYVLLQPVNKMMLWTKDGKLFKLHKGNL